MVDLSGKQVLTVVSTHGVEQDEIQRPTDQLRAGGASVTVAAPTTEAVQSQVRDWDLGNQIPVDATLPEVAAADYDLLLIPGGTLNADALRLNTDAQRITKEFVAARRPVAAICHGPWLLVETGVIAGKTATSYGSLRTDITNAGGSWHDDEIVQCQANGWILFTSRGPGDLPAFIGAIETELSVA